MPRQFISSIQPQSTVHEVFRVTDKQHRANRQGNMYLLVQLSDKTGSISGIKWNSDDRLYESFQKGDFIKIQAASQLHNGQLQLIVNHLATVDANEIEPSDFDQINVAQINSLWQQLNELIASIERPELRSLAEGFLNDESIATKLKSAPAGIKVHHSYAGGLLQHVVELMQLASVVAGRYPKIDRDLLLVGAFLHDIGKIEELVFGDEQTYSVPGQLMGHLVQGIQILDRVLQKLESEGKSLPSQELVWRIQHMIVSHHGSLEHGSPRIPMTLEAIALAYLDDLDAKLAAATELIESDRNSDSPWTAFNPTLGRKLYKPSLRS